VETIKQLINQNIEKHMRAIWTYQRAKGKDLGHPEADNLTHYILSDGFTCFAVDQDVTMDELITHDLHVVYDGLS